LTLARAVLFDEAGSSRPGEQSTSPKRSAASEAVTTSSARNTGLDTRGRSKPGGFWWNSVSPTRPREVRHHYLHRSALLLVQAPGQAFQPIAAAGDQHQV
jgi:hypothetical protein